MSKDVEELTIAERTDQAVREAFEGAAEQHRRAGVPMVVWRDGEVVEIPADELLKEHPRGPAEGGSR